MTTEQQELVERYLEGCPPRARGDFLRGGPRWMVDSGPGFHAAGVLEADGLAQATQLRNLHSVIGGTPHEVRLTLDMDDPWVLEQLWALPDPG